MSDANAVAVHSAFDVVEPRFHAALEASLDPRGPDALFEAVARLGLPSGATVVDVGCGRGRQAVELAGRFGFEVLGVDPVARHGPVERDLVSEPLTAGSVRFGSGTAEEIPVDSASVDLIFCRESVMFADLDVAATEFRRALRPGGRGLIYLVLTGPLMSDSDAEHFAMLMRGRNLRPDDIEQALERTGFVIDERID